MIHGNSCLTVLVSWRLYVWDACDALSSGTVPQTTQCSDVHRFHAGSEFEVYAFGGRRGAEDSREVLNVDRL